MPNLFQKMISILLSACLVTACQLNDNSDTTTGPLGFLKLDDGFKFNLNNSGKPSTTIKEKPLEEILKTPAESSDLGSTFQSAVTRALKTDPKVTASRQNFEAKLAAVDVSESMKNFQVSGSVYGGIEDVSDRTSGVALVLNANRLIYDGGIVDATTSEKSYLAESAREDLRAVLHGRALQLGAAWIELEKYQKLSVLIESRLGILDPLISQLEKVAQAGIGDVSKVAAAQRTVAGIRVEQTRIAEGLAQAKLEFRNAFGALPNGIEYDSKYIAD